MTGKFEFLLIGMVYMVWASVENQSAYTTWDKAAVLVMRLVGIACVVISIFMGVEA